MPISTPAVVIGSCDRYAPCWPFVAHGLDKYWPDCPWPKMLVSGNLRPPRDFQSLQVSPDRGWGPTMFVALSNVRMHHEVILYMMEDTWLSGEPDTELLVEYARLLSDDKVDHIQLCPTWGDCGGVVSKWKHAYHADPTLMVFANSSAYRTSLQPGLWRVDAFLSLLRPGDDPWKFEIEGNRRVGDTDRYLCVREFGCLPFATGNDPSGRWTREPVSKGKWTVTAMEYVRAEGLPESWLNESMK